MMIFRRRAGFKSDLSFSLFFVFVWNRQKFSKRGVRKYEEFLRRKLTNWWLQDESHYYTRVFFFLYFFFPIIITTSCSKTYSFQNNGIIVINKTFYFSCAGRRQSRRELRSMANLLRVGGCDKFTKIDVKSVTQSC